LYASPDNNWIVLVFDWHCRALPDDLLRFAPAMAHLLWSHDFLVGFQFCGGTHWLRRFEKQSIGSVFVFYSDYSADVICHAFYCEWAFTSGRDNRLFGSIGFFSLFTFPSRKDLKPLPQ